MELDPAIAIAGLSDRPVDELRRLWTLQFGSEPLPRISRELLARAVAHRLQEGRLGGLSAKEQRQLERLGSDLARTGRIPVVPAASHRAGTRLVRQWHGQVHEVIVLDGSYLWKGERYRSLSDIARRITGARWSGPRFFGLTDAGSGASPAKLEQRHA